ncbi:hypothetical protein [Pseudarthrobacter sp. PS3-L1]|uniref:hypothetical protein n=1 Tax=Pseudarthrobacter sp. PS3-L1 TaxID=3046207 RepID=UPI0024B8B08D|nr:hypothetical protein [Pseudarthrobacter sp. PS3-L1]MDJ0319816.1 hypothetical protein [Pseudarthrobacter sp. PS3-L1]
MIAFDLGEDELAAFTRPVLDYLPAGFDPGCAAQAEIADVDARYELAAQDVAAARVDRIGAPVSEADMCERLLEFGDGRLGIAGLRYRNLDPDFAFIDLKLSFRVQDPATLTSLAAAVSSEYGHLEPRGFTFHEEPGLGFAEADLWTTIMSGSIAAAARQAGRPLPLRPGHLVAQHSRGHPSRVPARTRSMAEGNTPASALRPGILAKNLSGISSSGSAHGAS